MYVFGGKKICMIFGGFLLLIFKKCTLKDLILDTQQSVTWDGIFTW